MQEGQKTFEEVMARERTLQDDICDYLSTIDIKKLGELTPQHIQSRFHINLCELFDILNESPLTFIEKVKADTVAMYISLDMKYRVMPIDELASAFGFKSTEKLKTIFKKYFLFGLEMYLKTFTNMDKMVEEGKIGNV